MDTYMFVNIPYRENSHVGLRFCLPPPSLISHPIVLVVTVIVTFHLAEVSSALHVSCKSFGLVYSDLL